MREMIWGDDLWEVRDCGFATECWVWLRGRTTAGYGMFGGRGYAHVHSYLLVHGEIPEGLELDHLCRNRSCVNPEHLEAVTHAENMRRGAMAKVTQEQVEEIRKETGMNKDIAEKYGLESSYVSRLRRGVSRPH